MFVFVTKVRATLILEPTELLGPVGLQLFFLLSGAIEHFFNSWEFLSTTKVFVPMCPRYLVAVVVLQTAAGRRKVIRATKCNNMLLPGDLVAEILIDFIIEVANLVLIQSICSLVGHVQSWILEMRRSNSRMISLRQRSQSRKLVTPAVVLGRASGGPFVGMFISIACAWRKRYSALCAFS